MRFRVFLFESTEPLFSLSSRSFESSSPSPESEMASASRVPPSAGGAASSSGPVTSMTASSSSFSGGFSRERFRTLPSSLRAFACGFTIGSGGTYGLKACSDIGRSIRLAPGRRIPKCSLDIEPARPTSRMLMVGPTFRRLLVLYNWLYARCQSFLSRTGSCSGRAVHTGWESGFLSSCVSLYGGPGPTVPCLYVARTYAGVLSSSTDGFPTRTGNVPRSRSFPSR
mmetsp:Transcript_62005/g.147896  ORF Transcript_62005/g.147896 Transcript_62005/m.147896 type:complete len:226 (+) Transcript_62005:1045-1722(+)